MADKQKSCADDRTIKEIFFRHSGRLNRWRYFKRRVVLAILTYIFLLIGYKILGYEYGQVTASAGIYNGIISLIFLIPTTCLNIRRLQDMNQGIFLAVAYVILKAVMAFSDITFTEFKHMDTTSAYLVPILATFSMLFEMYFMISPGTYGRNKYGANPLDMKIKKVDLNKKM